MRLSLLLATVVAAALVATGNALTDSQDNNKITALRGAVATDDAVPERMLTSELDASEEERGRKKRRRRRRRWFGRGDDDDDDSSDDKKSKRRRRRKRRFSIFG
ncbi:hypothetical protein P3T76_003300 [Phytophthora citrophthora]|uniref:RxLR effector protein n=1 Tax=Phytophthora citrophthora TaxID=4793 RepID=A0AAD9LRL6_9STRA|nr:hypothetical protein P3T76_003300 [Phytophthora citrophthora]